MDTRRRTFETPIHSIRSDPFLYPVMKTRAFIANWHANFEIAAERLKTRMASDPSSRTLDGREKCPRGRRWWSSTGGRTD